MDKLILKVGFYSIYEKTTQKGKIYVTDNGKTVYSVKYKKYYPNLNREIKEFNNLEDAKKHASKKIKKYPIGYFFDIIFLYEYWKKYSKVFYKIT